MISPLLLGGVGLIDVEGRDEECGLVNVRLGRADR